MPFFLGWCALSLFHCLLWRFCEICFILFLVLALYIAIEASLLETGVPLCLAGKSKTPLEYLFYSLYLCNINRQTIYSNTDLGSFCRVQWKYDLSLGCLMCSEKHWKKDEDFLKTHHMSDTVLDTYHCIIHYLGIFTTSRKFQIIECWIDVNIKNKTERLKIFMFSFIQGLSVPLFDSKETNSIIEDNSFFKSFLTAILHIDLILVWLPMQFQERCSNSKCHIQTCPIQEEEKQHCPG